MTLHYYSLVFNFFPSIKLITSILWGIFIVSRLLLSLLNIGNNRSSVLSSPFLFSVFIYVFGEPLVHGFKYWLQCVQTQYSSSVLGLCPATNNCLFCTLACMCHRFLKLNILKTRLWSLLKTAPPLVFLISERSKSIFFLILM